MEIIDYKLRIDGHWYGLFKDPVTIDGEVIDERDWRIVMITDVPVDVLLKEWHFLVHELSDKEVELYNLKEAYLIAESKIINETDFKTLYGANNQKVRDNHVRNELADMVQNKADLQFSIDFIKQYIPLLREVIRSKE